MHGVLHFQCNTQIARWYRTLCRYNLSTFLEVISRRGQVGSRSTSVQFARADRVIRPAISRGYADRPRHPGLASEKGRERTGSISISIARKSRLACASETNFHSACMERPARVFILLCLRIICRDSVTIFGSPWKAPGIYTAFLRVIFICRGERATLSRIPAILFLQGLFCNSQLS